MTETWPIQRCCRGQGSKQRFRSSGQSCSRIIKKSSFWDRTCVLGFIVGFSWSDGEPGEAWSDLGGRYSQETGGLQLVDASVQDANAWKSHFDQVCCKLWERKGGEKDESPSLVVSRVPSLRLLLLSSQACLTPRGDCCNDTAELPKSRNEPLNPGNRLLLSTKHETLQLPVSSRSQRTHWKKRLLSIGICSDANSRVMTQLPQDKYFYLTTKPEAVQF